MNRKVALSSFVLLGIGAVAAIWWFNQSGKDSPVEPDQPTAVTDYDSLEVPPPLPYEFVTLPGAQRGDPEQEFVEIKSINKKFPIRRISTMVSEEGEDQIAFLHRVRSTMTEYSDRQGFEACAEICSDGTRHSVIVTTTLAVAYCAVKPICVEGHKPTHQSIHSHCPKMGRLRATVVDEFLSGGVLRRNKNFSRCDTETFSQMDFAGRRPGWLAGRKALYSHDGPSRIEIFGPAAASTNEPEQSAP